MYRPCSYYAAVLVLTLGLHDLSHSHIVLGGGCQSLHTISVPDDQMAERVVQALRADEELLSTFGLYGGTIHWVAAGTSYEEVPAPQWCGP